MFRLEETTDSSLKRKQAEKWKRRVEIKKNSENDKWGHCTCTWWVVHNFWDKMYQGNVFTRYWITDSHKASLNKSQLLITSFCIASIDMTVDKDLNVDKLRRSCSVANGENSDVTSFDRHDHTWLGTSFLFVLTCLHHIVLCWSVWNGHHYIVNFWNIEWW